MEYMFVVFVIHNTIRQVISAKIICLFCLRNATASHLVKYSFKPLGFAMPLFQFKLARPPPRLLQNEIQCMSIFHKNFVTYIPWTSPGNTALPEFPNQQHHSLPREAPRATWVERVDSEDDMAKQMCLHCQIEYHCTILIVLLSQSCI